MIPSHNGRAHGRFQQGPRSNYQIRSPEVRLIDSTGQQLGIMPIAKAMSLAKAQQTDLIEIAATDQPPVCKLIDRGRYLYEINKRASEHKKHQPKTKEIQISANIDPHDLETKGRQAREFLIAHDSVRVIMKLRGRENAHPTIASLQFDRLAEYIKGIGQFQTQPKITGKTILATFIPSNGNAKPPINGNAKPTPAIASNPTPPTAALTPILPWIDAPQNAPETAA